jgi:hypothetical protein
MRLNSGNTCYHSSFFLPLGATAQGELWPLEQSASILFYSEADWFLNNLFVMVWGQPHAQPLTWRTRVYLFAWLLPLGLFWMGASTSSYATAYIAIRVSGALEPHHHDKVETPSMGKYCYHLVHNLCLLITDECVIFYFNVSCLFCGDYL